MMTISTQWSEKLDLVAISAFISVGVHGGFRAAGIAIGMSSSGVSKAVARLEKQLGVQLLARTTRSVRLTPVGAAFHARCKTLMTELANAQHSAAASSTVPQGKLIISITSTGIGRNRVMPIVAEFIKLHPQVEVEARLSDRIVELVEEGIDLAIRIGHLPDSGLIARKIGDTRLTMCGSPEYLASAGIPFHPDELGQHSVVGYVPPGTTNRFKYRFIVDGATRTLSLSSPLTVDDGDALVAAALQSIGLVMVADYLIEDLVHQGKLVRVLRDFEMPAMPVSVVYPPSKHQASAARVLIDMLARDAHAL